MKNGIQAICATLSTGLALLVGGCSGSKETNGAPNLEAVRANLKKQVASGALTMEEAQVRLAVATKEAKSRARPKESKALEALGVDLKEQVKKGALTPDEAKKQFVDAKKKSAAESNKTTETSK